MSANTEHKYVYETEILPALTKLLPMARSYSGGSYSARTARCEADTEDLLHDVALKAWESIASYEPGTNAKAWLATILRHRGIDLFQRRQRMTLIRQKAADLDNIYGDGRALARDLDSDLDESKRYNLIADAIEQEPNPSRRRMLRLHYRVGVGVDSTLPVGTTGLTPYKAIAEIMRCELGTVMSGLHRGRASLRERLGTLAEE